MTIHVLHADVYQRLKNNCQAVQDKAKEPVRVFISHTSKTDDAVEWVKSLALFLIEQGIQARLDRFHLRRGMDLSQWMCNELTLANRVLVISDEIYKESRWTSRWCRLGDDDHSR